MVAAAAALAVMIAAPSSSYGSVVKDRSEETVQTRDSAEGLPFEKAIENFYQSSGSITDAQILDSARNILSDGDVLYSELNEDESRNAFEALSAYEEAKAKYLTSAFNDTEAKKEDNAVCREWDRQENYARMMVTEGAVIREMIPRFRIVSCEKKDGSLELDVDEWMTQGYSVSAKADTVNASSYSYSFSLIMECGENGVWTPSEINGTDINFAWLGEGEDPVAESQDSPASLFEVKSDMDAAPAAYAQISAAESAGGDGTEYRRVLSYEIDENAEVPSAALLQAGKTQNLTADSMYEQESGMYAAAATGYTYTPAKAAAYANQYWKNYNRSYKEYRGVDCANFVSQCLFAGGMPKTDDWYPQSVNWINVMGHIRHFKEYGTFLTASNANVAYGNPVYYDWNGNGTYDHVGICVGKNSAGMPVVDAHTSNVYHVPWSMGTRGKRATIVLRASGPAQNTAPSVPRNVWQTISGKVYFYGADGKLVKNRFLTVNGGTYYFNAAGVRVTGFFKVGTKWYYASVKNGQLLKGWQGIGGKIYYFSVSDFSRITPGMHKIGKATYYFNSKGVRQTSFIKVGSKWYYADKKTGKFVKGWKKIHGKWYYFDKKTMVKAVGWKTINGRKCYFDSKGILRKGKHG